MSRRAENSQTQRRTQRPNSANETVITPCTSSPHAAPATKGRSQSALVQHVACNVLLRLGLRQNTGRQGRGMALGILAALNQLRASRGTNEPAVTLRAPSAGDAPGDDATSTRQTGQKRSAEDANQGTSSKRSIRQGAGPYSDSRYVEGAAAAQKITLRCHGCNNQTHRQSRGPHRSRGPPQSLPCTDS
jgi:hypothetical protein